jgi:hypothetical protein
MSADEELFETWAPDDSAWSDWAKPVAFIGAFEVAQATLVPSVGSGAPSGWSRARIPRWSLICPGTTAFVCRWNFAGLGFRPVPLFNARRGAQSVVGMDDLVRALIAGASRLKELVISPGAPPVFLVDANRMGRRPPSPGDYDNRSVVLPQDFPSGNLLRERGVLRAMLVQAGDAPAEDLAHVLHGWQKEGLELLRWNPASPGAAEAITVRKPMGFGWLLQDWLARMGLRRSSGGGIRWFCAGSPAGNAWRADGVGE